VSWLRRRVDHARYLWRRALEENDDPHKFAFAVAIGTAVSASPVPPVLGMRSFSAIGLAWLFKKSKLTSWLGSHSFIGPMWVFAAVVEVQLGCFVLRCAPPAWGVTATEKIDAAKSALLAWWVGGVLFAPLCGVGAYLIARPIHSRYLERRRRQRAHEADLAQGAERASSAREDGRPLGDR
jgi:uncharacterized protein (DUF2062 family)